MPGGGGWAYIKTIAKSVGKQSYKCLVRTQVTGQLLSALHSTEKLQKSGTYKPKYTINEKKWVKLHQHSNETTIHEQLANQQSRKVIVYSCNLKYNNWWLTWRYDKISWVKQWWDDMSTCTEGFSNRHLVEEGISWPLLPIIQCRASQNSELRWRWRWTMVMRYGDERWACSDGIQVGTFILLLVAGFWQKKIFVIMHIIQCVTPKMKFIHNYKKKKMGGLNFGLEPWLNDLQLNWMV